MILSISLFRASTSRCFLDKSCWYFLLFFFSWLTRFRESFSSAFSLFISVTLNALMDSASRFMAANASLSFFSSVWTSMIFEACEFICFERSLR